MFRLSAVLLLSLLIPQTLLAGVLNDLPRDQRQRLFAIHGSNTIGEQLAPDLLQHWFASEGLTDIRVTATGVENERLVSALDATRNSRVEVLVAAHGSGTGYQHLLAGTGDIAASSRPAKSQEQELLRPFADLRSPQSEHVIAIDGLAIIVHPQNPVAQLSVEQLAALFSGDIQDWAQVGGRAGPVRVYARDDQSGTWDSFKSLVLGKRSLAAGASRYESNSGLSDAVALDQGGIGFVGLAAVRNARLLAVYEDTAHAMQPNQLTVATEDYVLSRRLFMYTRADAKPAVNEFIAFIQTDAGQAVVAETGFISQQVQALMPEFYAELPESFRALTAGAQRLTVNFRFEQGSAQLDNKALRDLQRLIGYSEQHPQAELLLIGFGDPKKTETRSQLLSRLRAMSVRRELVREGIYPRETLGFGDDLLVASVAEDAGRVKNRRVEVWVRHGSAIAGAE